MEIFVVLDCSKEVVLMDTGFDDGVDGGGGHFTLRLFQFLEYCEGFLGP